MFPQVNRKQEFTGDEFEQIIFGDQTNDVTKSYLAEELEFTSGMQRSHLYPDIDAGVPRNRYMLPMDYAGMSTQIREGLNKADDKPYYHIKGKVEIIDKKVGWEIQLTRCIFSDEVNLTKIYSEKMISISECVFLKGLTIKESQLGSLFISNLDGHKIKVANSKINVLSLSSLTQPIAIEATSVVTLGMFTIIK
jgi:hypothetical protein